MHIKKIISILALVLVATGVIVFFYMKDDLLWLKGGPTNCIRLRSGIVNVEINYSSEFISSGERGRIALYNKNDPEKTSVLYIDANYYETLESIINNSLVEQGPKYKQVLFNKLKAAFYRLEDEYGIWDTYRVPLGNRVIDLNYFPSRFLGSERVVAQKMLDSITIIEVEEDVADARVESCN